MAKYLDYSGLLTVWNRIKAFVASRLTPISENNGLPIVTITLDSTTGKITPARGTITSANVTIADSGNYFTGTTVEGALQEVGSALGSGGSVSTQISSAINLLDGNATASSSGASADSGVTKTSYGYVLNKVDEVDGKIKSVGSGSSLIAVDLAGAAYAAYTDALSTLKGTSSDSSSAETIAGAKAYADSLFGGITEITYNTSYSSIASLPSTGESGVIYLIPNHEYFQIEPSELSPAVTNPSAAGYYIKNANGTYSLTTDTTVVTGTTYYIRKESYDEYIYIGVTKDGQEKSGYEKLGGASLNLGDYLEKDANLTTADIEAATPYTT